MKGSSSSIGIMRITENFRRSVVHEAARVTDADVLDMLHHLAKTDALVVGLAARMRVGDPVGAIDPGGGPFGKNRGIHGIIGVQAYLRRGGTSTGATWTWSPRPSAAGASGSPGTSRSRRS